METNNARSKFCTYELTKNKKKQKRAKTECSSKIVRLERKAEKCSVALRHLSVS